MQASRRSRVGAIGALMATVLGAALGIAACQDGYPIAATRCDRFCDLTQASQCGQYNPATCVASCENGMGAPACHAEFDALLACLEKHETTCENSHYAVVVECQEAELALLGCADAAAASRRSNNE